MHNHAQEDKAKACGGELAQQARNCQAKEKRGPKGRTIRRPDEGDHSESP